MQLYTWSKVMITDKNMQSKLFRKKLPTAKKMESNALSNKYKSLVRSTVYLEPFTINPLKMKPVLKVMRTIANFISL